MRSRKDIQTQQGLVSLLARSAERSGAGVAGRNEVVTKLN